MQIAVRAADEAGPAGLAEERENARVGGTACACERIGLGRGKEIGRLAKGRDMLLDVVGERLDPTRGLDRVRVILRRFVLRGRYRAAKRVGEAGIDLARSRQMVERRILVETAHLD